MPYRLLLKWIDFAAEEPIGQDWLRSGQVAATVANVFGGVESRTLTAHDFVPNRNRGEVVKSGSLKEVMAFGPDFAKQVERIQKQRAKEDSQSILEHFKT